MERQDLVAKAAGKFKLATNSKHNIPVAPNLLKQNFIADKPNPKWAGDITYLMTSEGWLYLAVFIDLYSRSVIGWPMSTRMTSSLCVMPGKWLSGVEVGLGTSLYIVIGAANMLPMRTAIY